eukprot:CAMPEP_0204645794 /NCGR_PEP_ID=MMETSP0718-20130828/3519_1 /ASSEMBLY_ACC=CAM_ASM_000674 /TAXON_ID=230516 /ORGANISM="Chaetoceros curvisetus" /LENGTH=251 /DNA_ID=CAMNT_0051667853 /DNA_START=73 /DNA_END=826 /DNA_ORIENTATION=-
MSNFLTAKTAIVTGGSGTIGKSIAKSLLTSGCNVIITGRNQKRLDAAVADLTTDDANIGDIHPFSCEVTKEEDVINLFNFAQTTFGGIDLLVNNAGTSAPGATTELTLDDFRHVMEVNVTGPFLCSRQAIRFMKEKKAGGRIINIGSISAQSPRPDGCPYTTSKFALLGLTQSLSLDCRPDNIAVGIIHPGNVVSGMLSPEEVARRGESEGFMNPEDVAACVLAMASLPYHANVLEMTVIPTNNLSLVGDD